MNTTQAKPFRLRRGETCLGIVQGLLEDCYSTTVHFKLSFDEYLARKEKIYDHPAYKRLTGWEKGWVQGNCNARFAELYRYHLVWCHFMDGKWMPSEEYGKLGRLYGDLARDGSQSAHVWKDSQRVFSSQKKEGDS